MVDSDTFSTLGYYGLRLTSSMVGLLLLWRLLFGANVIVLGFATLTPNGSSSGKEGFRRVFPFLDTSILYFLLWVLSVLFSTLLRLVYLLASIYWLANIIYWSKVVELSLVIWGPAVYTVHLRRRVVCEKFGWNYDVDCTSGLAAAEELFWKLTLRLVLSEIGLFAGWIALCN